MKNNNGKNNPNYKGGITLKKHYCKECGVENDYRYNLCFNCGNKKVDRSDKNNSMFGKHHSKKTLKKLSLLNIGKNNAFYGKKHTKKTRQKIKNSKYHKNLFGKNNAFYGKHHSLKSRKKMSTSHKDVKLSLEHNKNISKALKGRIFSKEHRKKLSLINKGRKFSVEIRKKMSLGHWGILKPFQNNEYGPEFDSTLKERIRFRDKYKCQECDCTQIENGKQLDVHHLDYNKRNNEEWNLISLCVSCHRKTNSNRKYWIVHFNKKIMKKYDYYKMSN